MPSVVHLNVRAREGGAARQAQTLIDGLRTRGWTCDLVYGYGRGARRDPVADAAGAHAWSTRPRAAGNFAAHGVLGRDVLAPVAHQRRSRPFELAVRADVLHLHVVHSYWMSLPSLRRLLAARAGRPTVWTLHDGWALTGRCAQPGTCTRFRTGCGQCPDLGAYPPARLDLTARGHRDHARLLESPGLSLVACAQWLADEVAACHPGADVRAITNGVDGAFHAGVPGGAFERPTHLVVGADLSSPVKQDHDLVRRLDVPVATVGASSPWPAATNLGEVTDRAELARLVASAESLVFTSRVDYFPLSVAEALACGTPVLAVDSPAAREVLGLVGGRPADNDEELLRADVWSLFPGLDRASLAARAASAFSSEAMVDGYARLYDQLLAGRR